MPAETVRVAHQPTLDRSVLSAVKRNHLDPIVVECDDLIVGAGSAGCVAANRLSRNGRRRVILVEAGPDFGLDETSEIRNIYPLSYSDPRYLWQGLRASWHNTRAPVPLPQGRGVGGSSSVMGMWALRGLPDDYDQWERLGAKGWNWAQCLLLFKQMECDCDFPDSALHGREGPITLRRQARDNWPAFTRAVADAAEALGYEQKADINGEFADGVYQVPISVSGMKRLSAARAYLTSEVRNRRNLMILADTECSELLFRDGRVGGARLQRRADRILVHAQRTILTAGAIRSPELLLASGIGPADHLQDIGVVPRHHLPGVGGNLQNHACISLGAHVTGDIPLPPLSRSAAFIAMRASSGIGPRSDLYLSVLDRTNWTYFGGRIAAINAVIHKPSSRGCVRLIRTADGNLSPSVDFSLLSDPRDPPRLGRAVQMATAILQHPSVSELTLQNGILTSSGLVRSVTARTPRNRMFDSLASILMPSFPHIEHRLVRAVMPLSAEALLEAMRQVGSGALARYVTGLFHPTGTCRMGHVKDPSAVVSTDGKLLGLDGLYIADASVMPAIPRANTHIPTLMVAEKICQAICS